MNSFYDINWWQKVLRSGIIENDEESQRFHKVIKEKFQIEIAYSCFSEGKIQSSIMIIISNCDENIKKYFFCFGGRHTLNSNFPSFFKETAEKIIDECYSVLGKKREIETILYVYCLEYDVKALSIASTLSEMAEKLRRRYKYDLEISFNTGGPFIANENDPSVCFLFRKTDEFEEAKNNGTFEELKKICFQVSKSFDKFGYVKWDEYIAHYFDYNKIESKDKMGIMRNGGVRIN